MEEKIYNKFETEFEAFQKMSIEQQTLNRYNIVSLFKMFWDNNPTEPEFALCMTGIVIFPEIQYYMVRNIFVSD